MGFEASADEQAVWNAGHAVEDVPPLIAWLTAPRLQTYGGRAAAPARMQELTHRACAYIRRHPIHSVVVAATAGLILGMLWTR
jgi:hypothetical protein